MNDEQKTQNKNILREKTKYLVEFDMNLLGYVTEATEELAKEVFSDEELRNIIMSCKRLKANQQVATAPKPKFIQDNKNSQSNYKNSHGGFGTPPKGRYL